MKRTPGSVFAFSTHRGGVLRTVGTVYLLPPKWSGLEDWNANEVQALARMLDPNHDNLRAAARGKVLLASFPDPESNHMVTCCYQIQDKNADQVFCGNSTAAAAALAFAVLQQSKPTFTFRCNDRQLKIVASVEPEGSNYYSVNQTWLLKASDVMVQPVPTIGPKAVRSTTFNDYLIVDGSQVGFIPGLLGYLSSLSAKLAIIRRDGDQVSLEFFNCNGRHGASPQTGLATLALLRSKLPWLQSLLEGDTVITPGGHERLPTVSDLEDGTVEIQPSSVSVELSAIDLK